MKYTLLTLLVLSSLLLAGCATPSSTPTDTNPTVNVPTADADMDEKNEDNDDMNEEDDMNDDNDMNDDDNKNDAAANTVPADTTTVYAMSDIAANNTENSCRTTIRGNVYNLSAWIDAHP
jgi:cytochrome b involved in lipid metabolism